MSSPTLLMAVALIAALPAGAAEPAASYTGPVEVVIADDFDGGSSTTFYRFRQDGREITAWQNSAEAPDLRCGDTVTLDGDRFGDTLAVRSARVASRLPGRGAAGPGCSSTGEQRTAVILVTWPGAPALGATAPSLDLLMFDQRAFSAHVWYREMSYGKVSFSGRSFGPYTLDRAYTCSETSAMRTAALRAADADIDFTQYQRVILVFPRIADCSFGGMSTLGCTELQTADGPVRASFVWANSTSSLLSLLIHELGHSLGVGHSRQLRFPGASLEADSYRAVPVEYGDRTAAMGSGTYGDFAAAHKVELGWLDPAADVLTVDSDGDFLLAPLSAPSGVRALRVRRRAAPGAAGEWLWIEHRRTYESIASYLQAGTSSGFGGLLIRRETPDSATRTHLLDLTPASLDQASQDPGASSENWPDLPANTLWQDPHSVLEIQAGLYHPDGISVTIRFTDSCAVPAQTDITLTPDTTSLAIPVAAAPDCQWEALSGRTWLTARRDGEVVQITAQPLPNDLHRDGLITIGRTVVRVRQLAAPRLTQIVASDPPGPLLPVGSTMPLLFHLRHDNGLDDLRAVELAVAPGPGSSSAPCHFRFENPAVTLTPLEDGTLPPCELTASLYRVNDAEAIFVGRFRYSGPAGEALSVSLRAEDAQGVLEPWTPAAVFTTTDTGCAAWPAYNFGLFLSTAANNQGLTILSSSPSCPWTASSDSDWLRPLSPAGEGPGALRFEVAANPGFSNREGRLTVNGSTVRIVQFGAGEVQPLFVTLSPAETVVSGLAGKSSLAYSYGLADLVPAVSDLPWLHVTAVSRSADSRQVAFSFDANPSAEPRLGALTVGGRTFSVLQQGRQPE